MRLFKFLCILIVGIILSWLYYIYLNPLLFSKKEVSVPDVVGYEEERAIETLKESSLGYTVSYISGRGKNVAYTSPKALSVVKQGFTIKLYVYNNEALHYESFIGLSYDEIESELDSYCKEHLISYKVEYVLDNSLPEGVITSQSLNSNDEVKEGDSLVIKVSITDSFIKMPKLSGMNVYDAIAFLNENSLSFNLIYYYSLLEDGMVISQSIEEGKIIKKGNKSKIDIYVSKGLPLDITGAEGEIIESLSLSDNYDIIYVASNVKNKILKIIAYQKDGRLSYKIYISE